MMMSSMTIGVAFGDLRERQRGIGLNDEQKGVSNACGLSRGPTSERARIRMPRLKPATWIRYRPASGHPCRKCERQPGCDRRPRFGHTQATIGLMGIYGRNSTSVDARLNASLLVGPFAFTRSRFDNISDSVTGFGDLIPQFSLRWNAGVRNFMT